jgi:hypothetical protein
MGQSGSRIRFEPYLSKIQILGQPAFITMNGEELPLLVNSDAVKGLYA